MDTPNLINAGARQGVPSGLWRTLAANPLPANLPKGLDAAWDRVGGQLRALVPRRRRLMRRARRIVTMEPRFAELSDARLREALAEMRAVFRLGRDTRNDVDQAFALIREAAARTLAMRPYPVQVAAALAMEAGCIAEMATGEGKTLAATLPATLAGWRGRGCHVITVNDYLARRDAQALAKLYQWCGLRVAAVQAEMSPHQRRDAYLADITYATNKEVAADLLRDRLALGRTRGLPAYLIERFAGETPHHRGQLVMRGLHTAIVDEADSVLIDEAVTPLIIAGDSPNAERATAFRQAADIARTLEAPRDYRVNHRHHEIDLTAAGRERIHQASESLGGLWRGPRRREELVNQAISAREFYRLGKQYVIDEEKIIIVDEFTGRLMPDRTWQHGLHQAVEAKESLPLSPPKDTQARISFQRFFRLYPHLCGMTGTAREARHELWQIYHLPVIEIPTHRPCIRQHWPERVYAAAEARWAAVADHIREIHATGRPILVGTRSVEASEQLSERLTALDIPHAVLNALRHEEEAHLIAHAGHRGGVTVATNMAGRGTDIKLAAGVAERGGLHVVATERHEAGRVDRQLYGRAGRQGDPGTAICFASLEDELLRRYAPRWTETLQQRFARRATPLPRRIAVRLFDTAQSRAQRLALQRRKAVLRADDWLDEHLGFAGCDA